MIKRCFDLLSALGGLVLTVIPMLGVVIAIRSIMGSPVFFKQMRYGRNKSPFTIYKFRSMTNQCDDAGQLLPDEERVTKLGWFLRRTSLDELPQLWNILKGDMSLVGPRPYSRVILNCDERFDVKPGLTGLAQVTCRRKPIESIEADKYYIRNKSMVLDLKIVFMTAAAVVNGQGTGPKPLKTGFLKSKIPESSRMSDGLNQTMKSGSFNL